MEVLIGVVVGLILLTVIVVIHELGHAIVARRNGVIVEEFGIGFPPRMIGKKVKKSLITFYKGIKMVNCSTKLV